MAKVEVERRDAVTVVSLNRPEVHNAIDSEAAALLHSAFVEFAGNDDARVLVVTGRGGQAFSSGADLKDGPNLFTNREDPTCGPLQFSGLDPGKPVIAAIEGYCFAGGLELAAWCDFRIGGRSSEFGVLNRRWGIPLVDGGTQRLARIVGLGNALWLIETGVRIDVEHALRIGLVQDVTPDGEALKWALDLAERIATYPQSSLRADRSSTMAGLSLPLPEGLVLEERAGIPTLGDPDLAEGLSRFSGGDRPEAPTPASEHESSGET
jgi:enoyl-CoA hydratase